MSTDKPVSYPKSGIGLQEVYSPSLFVWCLSNGVPSSRSLFTSESETENIRQTHGHMHTQTSVFICNVCRNPKGRFFEKIHVKTEKGKRRGPGFLVALTYLFLLQPSTGRPRSCVLGGSDTCPVGFGCNLVAGTTTRFVLFFIQNQ